MINEMLFNFLLKAIYMKSYCTKKKREKKKKPFLLNNKVFFIVIIGDVFHHHNRMLPKWLLLFHPPHLTIVQDHFFRPVLIAFLC